jgi:nitroimidazol reductase NimA-like FMN-containing flavoprotein (pyridoxamine 5'-phosphate oxidase superfamily)
MHKLRRTDKAILDPAVVRNIIRDAKFVTLALSLNDEPYLVTLSHGFDEERDCIYFHSASEGRKIDIMKANPRVWGQALIDGGYQQGRCDHFYETAQFHGKITFVDSSLEMKHALQILIRHLDHNPEAVINEQITAGSLSRIVIGRIDIDFFSGKKAGKTTCEPNQISRANL